MSYMRGVPYVYDDGVDLVIIAGTKVSIPRAKAQELAAMIWHKMTPEEQQAAMRRVVEEHAGNFSADGVLKAMGEQTSTEYLAEFARSLKDEP